MRARACHGWPAVGRSDSPLRPASRGARSSICSMDPASRVKGLRGAAMQQRGIEMQQNESEMQQRGVPRPELSDHCEAAPWRDEEAAPQPTTRRLRGPRRGEAAPRSEGETALARRFRCPKYEDCDRDQGSSASIAPCDRMTPVRVTQRVSAYT